MNETQRTVADWAVQTFGDDITNARIAARANREMAELLSALTLDDHHPRAVEEAADVMIVLMRMVDRLGGDLQAAVDAKMAVNRARRWNVTNSDGAHIPSHHVDEPEQ